MIPDSAAALVSFLLLLAPGTVWQLRQARHEPAVKETALVEASRVVIASLVATGIAAVLLLPAVWLPLYRRASSAGPRLFDSATSALPYLAGVAATSVLACALALAGAYARWPKKPPINPGRQWNHVFVTMRPKGAAPPYLTVELLDGTVWRGELVSFDTDPEDDQRGISLGPPLRRKRPEADRFEVNSAPGVWRVVILAETQIKSIQAQYPSTPRPSQETAE